MRMASISCYRLLPAADRERLAFAALTDRHPNVVERGAGGARGIIENLPERLFAWLANVRSAAAATADHQLSVAVTRASRQPFEDSQADACRMPPGVAQALHVLEAAEPDREDRLAL